jgi:signal recognition particle subunit SEC65
MINYKNKKDSIIPFKTYILYISSIKKFVLQTQNQCLQQNITSDVKEYDEYKFENFPETPQILIIGEHEYNKIEILKSVINKLHGLVNTSNTTVYTAGYNKIKYSLPSTITINSQFKTSTIEEVLACQMDTPDEQYSNKWQNFDTCINVFDKCFSESEFRIIHKAQFTKMFKYAKKYKIINIIILNCLSDDFANSDFYKNFDLVFCTEDI